MNIVDHAGAPAEAPRTACARGGAGTRSRSDKGRSDKGRGAGRLAVMLLGLLAAIVLSVCLGGQPSSPQDAWHAVFTPDGSVMDVTVRELRWPRTILAVVVGICLGLAGTLVQGHTRNPVATRGSSA